MKSSIGVTCVASLVLAGLLAIAPTVRAQDEEGPEYVPTEVEATAEAEHPWDYILRVGLSAMFGSSKRVIGNVDGNTWTFSLSLDGGVNYLRNHHEWRNTLGITEAFTRTPVIDEFVKSGDDVDFESIYLYHIPAVPWFGPFARFRLNTSLLPGKDVRGATETYVITYVDGTTQTVVSDRLDLTDPFYPLTLKEAAGVFAAPETRPEIQFQVLLGFGGRETFAANQLAVQDNGDTPEIEVLQLDDVRQAGAELTLDIWGDLLEGQLSYQFGSDFMMPFVNNLAADDNRNAAELTNIDIGFAVSYRIVEWASLDYELRAVREPQLLDEFQVQNNILFTLGYTLFQSAGEEAE